jgi:hypothetical protein
MRIFPIVAPVPVLSATPSAALVTQLLRKAPLDNLTLLPSTRMRANDLFPPGDRLALSIARDPQSPDHSDRWSGVDHNT